MEIYWSRILTEKVYNNWTKKVYYCLNECPGPIIDSAWGKIANGNENSMRGAACISKYLRLRFISVTLLRIELTCAQRSVKLGGMFVYVVIRLI